jgi:hypothetical protein
MPTKMKYLASLAQEIDKFTFEVEEEAKQLIEKDLVDLRLTKKGVMDQARGQIFDHREALKEVKTQLDEQLAKLSNTVNPTST